MFSARKKPGSSRDKGRHGLLSRLNPRPRVGIRVWLTVLFLLVTAFAGGTAYEVVRLMFFDTLNQASAQSFAQVGEQFESELRQAPDLSAQSIQDFATGRGLQWGIVRASDGQLLRGDLENWNVGVVERAVSDGEPAQQRTLIRGGVREGQLLATYAAPMKVAGEQQTAVVFTNYFTESDIENVPAVVNKIERIALLAGALAMLITGVAGYVAADLIARRVSRLGLAADRLAAGNFDERIGTHIGDEIGALGVTFNSMASSLKGAFRQVEQEKERGEAILDGMTDAVVGVDEHLNPVFVNPRARELLDSADRDFHNHLQEVLSRTTSLSGPITEPEVEVATESGNRFIEVRTAPLEEGALAILRDVTREHQISHAKSEFIANASHELKTPLSALSGYLEMLEDEEDEGVRRAFLDDMRQQTERLQNLARTLLDLSRLDADAVTFRTEEVDLEDTLHALRRDFGYTGRSIDIRAEEARVETDPNQLHRMLAILVDNALKYSPENAPVEVGLARSDGHAVINVTDRGCGIPEEEVPHIFDRFYRAQGSSRADGTGLGLALAGEIATHLGGEIEVESSPEEGSTFSVRLPV